VGARPALPRPLPARPSPQAPDAPTPRVLSHLSSKLMVWRQAGAQAHYTLLAALLWPFTAGPLHAISFGPLLGSSSRARAETQTLPYQAGTAPAPPCSLWLQRRPPGGDSGAGAGRGLHLDGRAAAAAAIAEAEAAGGRICAFFAESILSCGGQARARVFSGSLPGAPRDVLSGRLR